MKAIDLFAGCGGLSFGFEKAGFNIVKAVEFDSEIAKTYSENHRDTILFVDDIKNVDNIEHFNDRDIDVIIGGPPCQGFSMAGSRIRNGFVDDPRNYLFKHYLNIVKLIKPSFFILENVKGIINIKNGQIFEEIKKSFEDPDIFDGHPYKIQYKVVKAVQFGIPQKRERAIIIGSLIDFDLDEEIFNTKEYIVNNIDPHFFDPVSVWDAISNLPEPTSDGLVLCSEPLNDYQRSLASNDLITSNHVSTKHNIIALERIRKIQINQNFTSLDEKINSVHSGSYGRLDPNKPSQTITTRFDTPSGGRFIHPYSDRTLTPREAARLQSFPDNVVFKGNKTSIHKQIGNAVPPKLAYFFGIMIMRLINGL